MPQLCEAIVANQTPYVDTVADCDVLVIGMGASGATGNNVSGMSVAAYVNIGRHRPGLRPDQRPSRGRECRRGEQVISSPSKGRQV